MAAADPPCPRGGFTQPGPVECPRCGVVFEKLKRPPRPGPEESPSGLRDEPRRRFSRVDAALVLALLAATAVIWLRISDPEPAAPTTTPPPAPERPQARTQPSRPERGGPARRPATAPEETPPPPAPQAAPFEAPRFPPAPPFAPGRRESGLPAEDEALLERLEGIVRAGVAVDRADLRDAEDLYRKHSSVAAVAAVVEDLLVRAGRQAQARGESRDAIRYLSEATDYFSASREPWTALIEVHEAARDWRAAEQVARRGVSNRPEDGVLHRALATALMRQDRNAEAAEVLRRFLARHDDPQAQRLLARLAGELESGRGMAQLTSLHFRVRFEGEADDALGKALLEVLEEKHAMLARTLGYDPRTVIPVILYPRQTFRSVSTSPRWAGATYSHFDGRIRIGTRDLSAGFVPLDLERTLTHEVVHAFVDWRTRGRAPGDLNEGLAQYLSGKRLGYRLAAERTVIRNGQMNVRDYYDSALSFVEYLLNRYGQSTMNDLLKRMGELGNVDEAFRRAYGQGYAEMREEWIRQLERGPDQ